MPEATMNFCLSIACDECGDEFEMQYQLNLRHAARNKKVLSPKWFTDLDREVNDLAKDNGWIVSGQRFYCSECASKLEDGEIKLQHRRTTPKSLIDDLRLSHSMKQQGIERNHDEKGHSDS